MIDCLVAGMRQTADTAFGPRQALTQNGRSAVAPYEREECETSLRDSASNDRSDRHAARLRLERRLDV